MKASVKILVDTVPVTVQLEEDDFLEGGTTLQTNLTSLIYTVRDVQKCAEENGAKIVTQSIPEKKHLDGGTVDTDEFDVQMIRHTFEGGKHRYRICGGRWLRWGVPIYPECIMTANVQDMIFNSRLGDTEVGGLTASAMLRNGKPVKCMKVEENEHFGAHTGQG